MADVLPAMIRQTIAYSRKKNRIEKYKPGTVSECTLIINTGVVAIDTYATITYYFVHAQ